MKKAMQLLIAMGLALSTPIFAEWGDITSIDGAKRWREYDRELHIRGTIREVYDRDGILVSDDTGEIHVHLTNSALRDYGFHPGMRIEIRGIVGRDHDGYWEHHHHWDRHHWEFEANAIRLHDGDGPTIGA